ncbi:MAG: S8 family peptidase [Desulfobacter sp.]|nr:S8 family peptidase [Desulfobacter sp.]
MPTSYSHILLTGDLQKYPFKPATSGGNNTKSPPDPDRQAHSSQLRDRLQQAWQETQSQYVTYHATRSGVYLEFKENPGFELAIQSLENMKSKKIRLLNVRKEHVALTDIQQGTIEQTTTFATVYVDNEQRDYFFDKIEEYATRDQKPGVPKNKRLINSISDIRQALNIKPFWLDTLELIPGDTPEWCEIWLRSDESDLAKNRFNHLLARLNIPSKSGCIRFPERLVKVVFANRGQLDQLTVHSDDIAEFRRAKELAGFWTGMNNAGQTEWVQELLERTKYKPPFNTSVCILDTGVNNMHPLLLPILSENDRHEAEPGWGKDDHDKHGTLMAGVAAYGDIVSCLASSEPVQIGHCLESVKILPKPPEQTEPDLWGDITARGIYQAEIPGHDRRRIFCMAVSSADTRDMGRPSSWSGRLDQLASGTEDDTRRLLIVCAGNINDTETAKRYPKAQVTDSVHDPGQSWNALTVGAYTDLNEIKAPDMAGYEPVAPKGCLSPFSTTSTVWNDDWPVKPEIVMEGGNLARDAYGFASECSDLALLSTFHKPYESHFYPFNMTSSATAQAAWFAAQIRTAYPDFWPETVRALMIHSASWTESLKRQFSFKEDSKASVKQLMRICGYGVPDLNRALRSASDSLTLISQKEIQPYKKESGKNKTNEMHLHELPWPEDELRHLYDTEVELRITLSYFIEPGPGEIGWKNKYRYPSHGLRFHLNSPGESKEEFVDRINKATRENEKEGPGTESSREHWVIGIHNRHKGSVHSDIWRGTAADLAACNMIAVTPTIGWWRERGHLGKVEKKTRYSLVVSISTPEQSADIYTPVAVKIGAIPIAVST